MEEHFLVFDLETVGAPFGSFDEAQQEYLLRNTSDDAERTKRIDEMALSPITGRIVCIGMQSVRRTPAGDHIRSVAYSVDDSMEGSDERTEQVLSDGSIMYLSSERTMLENFWNLLTQTRCTLVSFNGRNFDAPWLMLRSALLEIRPSRNLMDGTKFNYSNHVDLLDKLTFFQGSASGATRRFNFDFFAKAFGVESPKSKGIDGSKVGAFFSEGRITEISEYCLRDVRATWELYLKWEKYLKP